MTQAARFERLSMGERFAVEPAAIERELSALWREAGQQSHDQKPVTRACLWNVAAHAERRPSFEGGQGAGRLVETIRDLPRYVAVRAIVAATEPERPVSGGPDLESWISANCALASDGSKIVCSEEVTVAAYGAGETHIPALLHALLVPDVPTAAIFAGVPPRDRVSAEGLIDVADRLITRADRSRDPFPLARLSELAEETALGLIDLGWLLQGGLRHLVAELFEPPAPDAAWRAIERIVVFAREEVCQSARLFVAWLATSLGSTLPPRAEEGSKTSWSFDLPGGRIIRACIEPADAAAPAGVSRIEVAGARGSFGISWLEGTHWKVAPCGAPVRHTVVEIPDDARLLASALLTRGEDVPFTRALAAARFM